MNILIACEFSGIVRDAFIARGHDAISCDLLPTESPGPHYQGDVFDIVNEYSFDLMIAHPPCTYLSNAGAKFLYPKGKLNYKRWRKGMEAADFFMRLYNVSIPMIAIENPQPSKIYGLPRASQVIHPYEFGHRFTKRTLLWLKNLPPLLATVICGNPETSKKPGNWFNKGGNERQKNRAKTFKGIAQAMAEQWG